MRAVVLILGGAGGGSQFQFLPDGIFTQRRRPYTKMGHLKRKADASTHTPLPTGYLATAAIQVSGTGPERSPHF